MAEQPHGVTAGAPSVLVAAVHSNRHGRTNGTAGRRAACWHSGDVGINDSVVCCSTNQGTLCEAAAEHSGSFDIVVGGALLGATRGTETQRSARCEGGTGSIRVLPPTNRRAALIS